MPHPEVEQLPFIDLQREARLCGFRIEDCKRRLNNPHSITEFLKAREDMPYLREYMRRVTGAYMKKVTPNPNWR